MPLRGGGSLVIDQTEALVAIDVNSGSFRTDGSAEESAYQLNQIAAKEIARQLRLRDLGGVVVNDFIDMRKERHRRDVERTLRDAVKRDRARTKILRTSPFGLIEMTRQRIRPSLKRSVYKECPACGGSGLVKSAESMAIEVVRKLLLRDAPRAGRPKSRSRSRRKWPATSTTRSAASWCKIEDDNNVAGPGRQRRGPVAGVFEDRLRRRQRPRSADCRSLKNGINWKARPTPLQPRCRSRAPGGWSRVRSEQPSPRRLRHRDRETQP